MKAARGGSGMTRLKAHDQRFLAPFIQSSRIIPEVLTDFSERPTLIAEAGNEDSFS